MPKRNGGGGWAGRRQAGQGKRRGKGRAANYTRQHDTGEEKATGASGTTSFYGGGKDLKNSDPNTAAYRQARRAADDLFDREYGFDVFEDGPPRLGWLLNMLPTSIGPNSDINALEMFFLEQDGSTFKCYYVYRPYFYVLLKNSDKYIQAALAMFQKRYEGVVVEATQVEKIDLDMPNHWNKNMKCLRLSFHNIQNLQKVRKELQEAVKKNKDRAKIVEAYEDEDGNDDFDIMDMLIDLREYDVQYYTRVSIDNGIHVGCWYKVMPSQEMDLSGNRKLGVCLEKQDIVEKASPKVLAFDIECAKEPLKFPDANRDSDEIYMISYMLDGQGYLITNRAIVSSDIEDFEYSPKPEFPGPFAIFNEPDERALIRKFFDHCKEIRPNIYVTYNGDWFDWPYVEKRAERFGMDMRKELGIYSPKNSGEYRGRCCVHIDCLYWVKRDSYLPAGSRGLKAVTKAKLGYDPVEVEAEEMLPLAKDNPIEMASYSVSDAVATFYLYDKYINLFIFSLCTIIPMGPDDVLRKGSGTLCEMLLMIEAFNGNIICPNKQNDPPEKFTADGRLLDSDTYVGGHVECLESGVYRDDLPNKFDLDPAAFDELIANIDRDLCFAIEVEGGIARTRVENYDEVRDNIIEQLEMIRDTPVREEEPRIYHLDVAAMYPNIILTNRLQPSSIVSASTCASCIYNKPGSNCKREMEWMWRGDVYPATRSDYLHLKSQIEYEKFDGVPYHQLQPRTKAAALKKRMKGYCQTVYKRVKDTEILPKMATVCQRENPFYVNTVKAFRDRRYEYKMLTKNWVKKKIAAAKEGDIMAEEDAGTKVVVYDSLQLAHKCILNSFYGYVMRKGARWHSMEMAAITTHTGGNLIKQARQLVERVGRPLELDTDGIWCILPSSFPENFTLNTTGGKKINISYPCVMLNAMVHENFTNHQYQDLVQGVKDKYDTHSECSIYFEVDGPYRCMVIPASQEEGKLLKKRYAVFNFDGSLAELKGFELKRRGELNIVKIFQSQCFPHFLNGSTLASCYQSVAEIANFWLEVLYSKGSELSDAELIDLISENRSMSKTLEEYGDQKSNSVTTAKRLAAFLGNEMVKDKGLACKLLIAARPKGYATSARAIPCAIFGAEEHVRQKYLRKWTGSSETDLRDVIDWDYYIERLASCMMKIISIPAALQQIDNPIPSIVLPPWVKKMLRDRYGPQQRKITNFFTKGATGPAPIQNKKPEIRDIEDLFSGNPNSSKRATESLVAVSQNPVTNGKESDSPTKSSDLNTSTEEVKDKENQDGNNGETADNAPNTNGANKRKLEAKSTDDEVIENFDMWLASRKSKWRTSIRRRRQRRFDNNTQGGAESSKRSSTMSEFISENQRKIKASHWQIVDFKETSEKGKFKLSVLSGTQFTEIFVLCNSSTELMANIGCVAKLHHTYNEDETLTGNGTIQKPYGLSSIKRLVTITHPYLEDGYDRAYIYHCGKYNRHLIALFLVETGNLKNPVDTIEIKGQLVPSRSKCICWTIGPGKESAPNFQKILTELTEGEEKIELSNVIVSHSKSVEDCYTQARTEISKFSQRTTLVLAQTSHKNGLRTQLRNKYPIVFIPFDNSESDSIPSLQYQVYLAKLATSHYIRHTLWWNEHVEAARYGHVPVSLMGEDYAETIYTCFYARMLKHNRIMIDDHCKDGQYIHLDDEDIDTHGDVVSVVSPGVYRSFCVEIEVGNLAVNAIIEAERILEYEGATLDDFAGEVSGSGKSFKVLRALVINWIHDAKENDNRFADVLINNLYRIIVDRNSRFYNVKMHGFVDRLIKKLFMQLLAEFRRLGAKIVHANQNKIILNTLKTDPDEAMAFFEYTRHQIREKKIFSIMYLEKTSSWSTLLYMDEFNWCAIEHEEPQTDNSNIEDEDDSGENTIKKSKKEAEPSLLITLGVSESLNPDGQDMLKLAIGDMLLRPFKQPDQEQYVKQLMTGYMQQKVMEFIGHHQIEDKDALQLLNVLMYLMSLDKAISNEVLIVKRNCLRLLQVQEFAPEARFTPPEMNIVLKNVTCQTCWFVSDLNVSRDPFLKEYASEGWICKECESAYNMDRLESLLVDQANISLKRFLQSDLKCKKCTQVRNDNTSPSCPQCSGKWLHETSEQETMKVMGAYLDVANYYEFDWLKETVAAL